MNEESIPASASCFFFFDPGLLMCLCCDGVDVDGAPSSTLAQESSSNMSLADTPLDFHSALGLWRASSISALAVVLTLCAVASTLARSVNAADASASPEFSGIESMILVTDFRILP